MRGIGIRLRLLDHIVLYSDSLDCKTPLVAGQHVTSHIGAR